MEDACPSCNQHICVECATRNLQEEQLRFAWNRIAKLEAGQLKLLSKWEATLDKYTKLRQQWEQVKIFIGKDNDTV